MPVAIKLSTQGHEAIGSQECGLLRQLANHPQFRFQPIPSRVLSDIGRYSNIIKSYGSFMFNGHFCMVFEVLSGYPDLALTLQSFSQKQSCDTVSTTRSAQAPEAAQVPNTRFLSFLTMSPEDRRLGAVRSVSAQLLAALVTMAALPV